MNEIENCPNIGELMNAFQIYKKMNAFQCFSQMPIYFETIDTLLDLCLCLSHVILTFSIHLGN